MRITSVGLAIGAVLLPSLCLAQTRRGTCEQPFQTGFAAGGRLQIHVRSGDVEIAGSDAAQIRVTCRLKHEEDERDVKIEFQPAGSSGELRISGGPSNEFHVRIEIPRRSHLFVRTPAGNLAVNNVTGDKDVELHAGNLVMAVGKSSDYAHADASVLAGDLTAPPFDVSKGGLFRSFTKDNPAGKYRLHAHVGTGELELR